MKKMKFERTEAGSRRNPSFKHHETATMWDLKIGNP
jgi:hypothetical protein